MEVMVTYLEMTAPPSSPPRPEPCKGLGLARETISRSAYLALYAAVGEPVQWDSRPRMEPSALDRLLGLASTHLHVLWLDGQPVGIAEFVDVGEPDVELAHFGLVAGAQGRGLGGFLLDRALRAVWAPTTARIWLHTDTNDSAAAIPIYLKAGFRSYLARMETFPD